MGANPRTKGASGEREIADALNAIIIWALGQHNIPIPEVPPVQRNSNQSAVGGNDLSNTFGVSIEVKRQEQLSINTWWKQCQEAAARNDEIPVLVYRQNRQAWRVVMQVALLYPASEPSICWPGVRAEISWEDFQTWYRCHVMHCLQRGDRCRI